MRAILRHSALCVLVLAGMASHATRSHAATQDRAAPSAASALAGITDDARVLGALEELWRLESEEQQPAVVQRLAALRSGAEETYLQGLAITYGPGAAGDHRSALRRETLVELLSGCHPDALRGPLRAAAASDEPALRCAALRLLGEIGDGSQIELLFEAVAERPGAPEPDRQARDLFEEALAGLLARDPAAYDALDQRPRELSPASEVSVVRAIGAAGRVEGLPYLVDAAAWETVPAETALAEIARLAPKVRGPCAVRLGELLIGHASPERPQACQAATQALGRLGCEQAVEVLIDLLDEEHRGVRESAHWALGRITGQSLALDLERWRAWHDVELDWYSSSGAPLDAAARLGRSRPDRRGPAGGRGASALRRAFLGGPRTSRPRGTSGDAAVRAARDRARALDRHRSDLDRPARGGRSRHDRARPGDAAAPDGTRRSDQRGRMAGGLVVAGRLLLLS